MNSSPRHALLALLILACACEQGGSESASPGGKPPAAATAAGTVKKTPEQTAPFVPATLESIRAGQQQVSARVAVDVSLVVGSVIRASENGGRQRYYMLAVDDASEYAQEAAAIERDANQLATDVAAKQKDKKHKPTMKTAGPLITRLLAIKDRLLALKLDPQKAMAVELQPEGLERVAFQWDTVLNECEGLGCGPRFPATQAPSPGRFLFNPKPALRLEDFPTLSPPVFDSCAFAATAGVQLQCLANVEVQLDRLKAQDPPHLDEAMPKITVEVHEFDESRVIRRYNALVRRYNAEVTRRQQATVAMLPSHVDQLVRLSGVLKGPKITLHGVVDRLPGVALRTYEKTHGVPPVWCVRELAPGEETFASTFYRRTQYCITSYPPHADISIRGEKVGRTPRCIPDLVVGEPLELEVAWAGSPAVKLDPAKVQASPGGLAEIDCKLSKGDAPSGSCKILQ
jgi:hypothetical protein